MIFANEKVKIVNVNGSPHGSIGNTQTLVNMLVDRITHAGIKVILKNHFLVNEHIENCRGCTRCMRKGQCVLKDKDDINTIVEDLLDADLVIYSSPIYVLNVTGLMKTFFDRTAFMTHRLTLENKAGIFVLSSQGLGVDTTSDYLMSVMEAQGITNLGAVKGTAFIHGVFTNTDDIEKDISNIVTTITSKDALENLAVSESETNRREKFKFLMNQESISTKLFAEDYKYWKQRGELSNG